jgi:hypothetical protein
MNDKEWIQNLQDISGAHFMRHMNSECLAGVFIHHGQHFLGPVITQLVMYKIDSPKMVRPIGAHTDDGTIFMILATSAFMALRQLQPPFTPKSLDFLMVHLPA